MILKIAPKSLAFVATSALAISGFFVPTALAESVQFTLINNTNRPLEEFYASPPSEASWEEDILGVDVLLPGESAEITIDDGREDCLYDIRGVLGAGDGVGQGALIHSGVNICDGVTYTYSN